jgi:thiol-disulfide isomerase/thioredoxin
MPNRKFARLGLAGCLIACLVGPASAADQAITLQTVDKQGYQKAIGQHKGKVVLVDVWATWCVPCRKGFPHTVELHKKYGKQGLAVVSLSLDEAEDEPQAREFLQQQGAEFANLRSKFGADEAAIEAFEIDHGAIPHFKLYGRDGKLVKKFVSGDPTGRAISHDEIEAAVKALLEKP